MNLFPTLSLYEESAGELQAWLAVEQVECSQHPKLEQAGPGASYWIHCMFKAILWRNLFFLFFFSFCVCVCVCISLVDLNADQLGKKNKTGMSMLLMLMWCLLVLTWLGNGIALRLIGVAGHVCIVCSPGTCMPTRNMCS